MAYRYFIAAAVLISPWVFTLPTVDDWARFPKEQWVLGTLAFLPVWRLWTHNRFFSLLLGYLNLSCMFRDNPDVFSAWISVLVYSLLYLFLREARDDFRWLRKTVAISCLLVMAYGALQFFHVQPVLSAVNAVIRLEGEAFANKVTKRLLEEGSIPEEEGSIPEGEVIVEGKDYLKKIIYRKAPDGKLEAELKWVLPTVESRHLRISGMFGNPNDWLGYVLTSFPFVFFLLERKKALAVLAALVLLSGAVFFIKYKTPTRVNVEAGPTTSLAIRSAIYGEILDRWKERWLFGHGLGTFKTEFPKKQKMTDYGLFTYAHNDYLQFLFETGLIGFLLLLGTVFHPLGKLAPLNKEKKIYLSSLLLFAIWAGFNFPAHIAPAMLTAFIAFVLVAKSSETNVRESEKNSVIL